MAKKQSKEKNDKPQEQHQDIDQSIALEIVKLLAESNIPIISVDRVFMFVKNYINALPLGVAMPLLENKK